jgi:hypothetical protein
MTDLLGQRRLKRDLKEKHEIIAHFKKNIAIVEQYMPTISKKVLDNSIPYADFLKIAPRYESDIWYVCLSTPESVDCLSLVKFREAHYDFKKYIDSVNQFWEQFKDVLDPEPVPPKPPEFSTLMRNSIKNFV